MNYNSRLFISIIYQRDIFTKFTDLCKNDSEIYIFTQKSILKYDIKDDHWIVAVEPSAYNRCKVINLIIRNWYCILGTNNGIWGINIADGNSHLYDFPFIGSVQDLYIQDDTLLIGSNNGFIKYLWKKNL